MPKGSTMLSLIIAIVVVVFVVSAVYSWYSRKETLVGHDKDGAPIYVDTACVQASLYDGAATVRKGTATAINAGKIAFAHSKVQTKIAKMNADAAGISLKDGWNSTAEDIKVAKAITAERIAKIEAEGDIKIAAAATALKDTLDRIKEAKARAV